MPFRQSIVVRRGLPAILLAASLMSAARRPSSAQEGPPPAPIRDYSLSELSYADRSSAARLDLYLPRLGAGPFPLVIWIHGGGFRVGDKSSMPSRNLGPPPVPRGPDGPFQIQVPDVDALARMGYAVASLDYRLGPDMPSDALDAVRDGKAAVRFLRANVGAYRLDATKFAVWSNSAGGYMAAMLGATGDQRTVFDNPALGHAEVSSAVEAVVVWLGAEDRLPSPLGLASHIPKAAHLPPFRIANGDADPIISPARAERLRDALVKAGATVTLTILSGAGHEDPAFTANRMEPTFAFLNTTFGR